MRIPTIHRHFWHLFIVLAFTVFVAGCGKKEATGPDDDQITVGTMTFTLNGGGFNNQVITLSNAVAVYEADEQVTGVGARGVIGTDSISCAVAFPGNRTGTFSWSPPDYGLGIAIGNRAFYGPVTGTTTVTSYGTVGSTVSGSFSGKIVRLGTSDTVTVSNGRFSARRIY